MTYPNSSKLISYAASITLSLLLLLTTSVASVYAEDANIKPAQNINALNFSLNSITLSSNDMSVDSVELSSSIITEKTTDFHLLTPLFLGKLPVKEVSHQNTSSNFITGQIYAATSSKNGNNVIVGNYNYIYENANAAEDVLAQIKTLTENDRLETIPEYTLGSQIAVKLAGEDNDSVYWYISTKDNSLTALSVNGLSNSETFQTFEAFIAKVAKKKILKANSNIYLPILQGSSNNGTKSVQAAWRGPAYQVAVAFTTSGGWNPHYGAWFIGRNGRSQYFICWYEPSGYSSWNWWGNNRNVLLLEKKWLFSVGQNGWRPGCHYAVTDR